MADDDQMADDMPTTSNLPTACHASGEPPAIAEYEEPFAFVSCDSGLATKVLGT